MAEADCFHFQPLTLVNGNELKPFFINMSLLSPMHMGKR